MKTSKRIISSVLAVLVVVSAMVIGGYSASAASLKKPTGLKLQNADHSIIIKWNKVSGAKKYEVFRDNKLIKTVSANTVRDYTWKGGITYAYKVRAVNGKKKSAFGATVKYTRLNYTVITSVANVSNGIKVKWYSRAGSTSYNVERRVATGSTQYKSIAYATGLSYIDKTAVAGTQYKYRVTCYNSKTKAYSSPSVVNPISRVEAVKGFTAKKTVDSSAINLNWTASTGATSYNIYRQKATEEDFVKIGSSTTTSYTDPNENPNPTAYRYYVKAVKTGNESVQSAERAVQTYGKTPARLDENGNYHLPLQFKVKDVYREGKALADYFSYNGSFDINITQGNDVIKIEDNVITALKAGYAEVVINVPEEIKQYITDGLITKLTSKDVILEITVS